MSDSSKIEVGLTSTVRASVQEEHLIVANHDKKKTRKRRQSNSELSISG